MSALTTYDKFPFSPSLFLFHSSHLPLFHTYFPSVCLSVSLSLSLSLSFSIQLSVCIVLYIEQTFGFEIEAS